MRLLQAIELRTETCSVEGGGTAWTLFQARSANKLTVGYFMRQEERGDRYDSPPPRR
jgi:hypothetical protein